LSFSSQIPIGGTRGQNTKKGVHNALQEHVINQQGSSYFLLLCTVRGIVEKHGGSMKLDDKTNSFVLGIPGNRKTRCFKELEDVIGHGECLDDFSPFFVFDSSS
jgi:hypothetical protein